MVNQTKIFSFKINAKQKRLSEWCRKDLCCRQNNCAIYLLMSQRTTGLSNLNANNDPCLFTIIVIIIIIIIITCIIIIIICIIIIIVVVVQTMVNLRM